MVRFGCALCTAQTVHVLLLERLEPWSKQMLMVCHDSKLIHHHVGYPGSPYQFGFFAIEYFAELGV